MPLVDKEDDNSDGEWSRVTYSDASRSPSPSKSFFPRPPPSPTRKAIKTKFYELKAGAVDWEDNVRERISARLVKILRQMMGLIRQRDA